MLDLNHHALALEEELASVVLVMWVEDLDKAAFLTDNEVLGLSAGLVLTVEVTLGLEVVLELEDLTKSFKELSLAGAVSTPDHDRVAFGFSLENKVLADVLDESGMVRTVNFSDDLLNGLRVFTDPINEVFQIFTGIR